MMYIAKKKKRSLLDGYHLNSFLELTSSIDKPHISLGRNIPDEMIQDITDSGVFMGLERENGKGYYVGKRSECDGNVLITGINGSGKSYVCAKSIIETWHEPMVVLDCKGELSFHGKPRQYKEQAERDRIIFDPLSNGVHYDPFALLKKDDLHLTENVREIAYTLIPLPPNDPNSYWVNMARDLLSAVVVYGFSIGLDFIETILMAVTNSVSELCQKIMRSDIDVAKMFIGEVNGLKKEQKASIGTDMKQHLMVFATDSCVQEALSKSENRKSFSWADISMEEEAPNVFLRLRQDRLEQWSGMIRLILTQLIRTLERRPDKHISMVGREMKPILLLLDEFPLLGKIDAITNALTTLRSKKVTFCLVIQSIAQLDAVYGSDIRKIIVDNCQYKVMLQITEPDSQEYFSRLIGTVPTGRRGISQNYDSYAERFSYGCQIQEFREPLILPHEFATNSDIWLYTPYGFLSTVKLPVSETYKHAYDFEKILQRYIEEKSNDC